MTFVAVTSFQGDFDWEVEVKVRGFTTAEAASNFAAGRGADSASKLRVKGESLLLITDEGNEIKIPEGDFKVKRLYGEPLERFLREGVIHADEFREVPVTPKDFQTEKGLSRGFESSSYGLELEDGTPLVPH